jgi:hypothetical protein
MNEEKLLRLYEEGLSVRRPRGRKRRRNAGAEGVAARPKPTLEPRLRLGRAILGA